MRVKILVFFLLVKIFPLVGERIEIDEIYRDSEIFYSYKVHDFIYYEFSDGRNYYFCEINFKIRCKEGRVEVGFDIPLVEEYIKESGEKKLIRKKFVGEEIYKEIGWVEYKKCWLVLIGNDFFNLLDPMMIMKENNDPYKKWYTSGCRDEIFIRVGKKSHKVNIYLVEELKDQRYLSVVNGLRKLIDFKVFFEELKKGKYLMNEANLK